MLLTETARYFVACHRRNLCFVVSRVVVLHLSKEDATQKGERFKRVVGGQRTSDGDAE
jgi:hypothetical protein